MDEIYSQTDEDVQLILIKAIKILAKAEDDIFKKAFKDLDAAFFDVKLDLILEVNGKKIHLKEKWKRLQE